jgi:hypothetical protein
MIAERNTPALGTTTRRNYPVAAGTAIYRGMQVALNAGYLEPATEALGLVAVGRASQNIDNSAGLAGARNCDVDRGTFLWNNAPGADAITLADNGAVCYMLDDQTVARTDGGGARSAAGRVRMMETQPLLTTLGTVYVEVQ